MRNPYTFTAGWDAPGSEASLRISNAVDGDRTEERYDYLWRHGYYRSDLTGPGAPDGGRPYSGLRCRRHRARAGNRRRHDVHPLRGGGDHSRRNRDGRRIRGQKPV